MMESILLNIAILDDQEIVLAQITQALKRAGITNFKTYTDAHEFIDSVDQSVSIAVIDYLLSGDMTGIEVCKEVHKKNPYCFIIIVSGQDDKKVVISFVNYGAKRYVEKIGTKWVYELVDFIKEAFEEIKLKMNLYAKLLASQKKYENEG